MVRSYRYSLVRIGAQAPRDERLNLGIAVLEENGIDVRLPKSLHKLQALSAALNEESVRSAAENLASTDDYVRTQATSENERLNLLTEFSPFSFSSPGLFYAHSPETYEIEISNLLRRLIEPEPAPPKAQVAKSSPLLSMVKQAFRHERVLAKKGEDLTAHRIVAGLQLAEGLSADLVLRNGSMHVIETVDAAKPDISLKKVISDIAVSALTIEQARIVFGETETKGKLVYQASSATEAVAKPALEAAEHLHIELINWASRDDQIRFITTISSLAVPLKRKANKGDMHIHASTQHKFNLN